MTSYIRVFHASPNAPAVDVYANGLLIANNINYGFLNEYIAVAPGDYTVEIFPSGTKETPFLTIDITIPARSIFTAAAINKLVDLDLQLVSDTTVRPPTSRVKLKFVHFSPNAPAVDITLPDGTILFSNVSYREVTDYITLNPSTYTLQARIAGTNTIVLTVPNQTLLGGRILSAYAIGLVGKHPPLQLVTPLEGGTYLTV